MKSRVLILLIALSFGLKANETIYTTHPQVARSLLQMAQLYQDVASYPKVTVSNLYGMKVNVHDFEPTTKELRKLYGKEKIIAGPLGHQKWLHKAQRAGLLSQKAALLNIFKMTREHFWLIPKESCAFEKFVLNQFHQWKLYKDSELKERDLLCEWTKTQAETLKALLKEKNIKKVLLTHNSLSPLLNEIPSLEVLVLKEDNHHSETSSKTLKKAYDWNRHPKDLLVIKEIGFPFPKNLSIKRVIHWSPTGRAPLEELIKKVQDL